MDLAGGLNGTLSKAHSEVDISRTRRYLTSRSRWHAAENRLVVSGRRLEPRPPPYRAAVRRRSPASASPGHLSSADLTSE